jgi:hypothetical protein
MRVDNKCLDLCVVERPCWVGVFKPLDFGMDKSRVFCPGPEI